MSAADPLSIFHPLIQKWFSRNFADATGIQKQCWPAISEGGHVLFSAPTGSGKTLAAFLYGVDRLIKGSWDGGSVRLLYVSPTKALNNDIRRNLTGPLKEIQRLFEEEGNSARPVRVLTRSGDTPQQDRRRMLKQPPEILITTPESLNLILSSPRARHILDGLHTVILDEIHAVAGSKRGVHLMSAVERLTLRCGEFQRIGISATVRPMQEVARFLGGRRLISAENGGSYENRRVRIISSAVHKQIECRVRFPENARDLLVDDSYWPALIAELKQIIYAHKSTLIFVNTRRHAEKIALMLNEDEPAILAYSHHGSLSREIRLVVEKKLKRGELKAIVATSSLELGIDIGALDEVVMVQAPFLISQAVQRIGRAGHRVGETSRGCIIPIHGKDFLRSGVINRALLDRDIEELKPVQGAYDMLAQLILSMTAMDTWEKEELFAFLRSVYAFEHLSRPLYERVIEMLLGKYADSRIRELRPRIVIDRLKNTLQAKDGVLPLLYHSGGSIPDRGYYTLRTRDGKAKIGELDEEFVWERKTGESFTLGSQTWRISSIGSQDVEVVPSDAGRGINVYPFWKAEQMSSDFYLSEKIALFLEEWEGRFDSPEFFAYLRGTLFMEAPAALELKRFLTRQETVCGGIIPHRRQIVIEHFNDPGGRADVKQVIVHTLWGGRINRPFSLILAAYWEAEYGYPLEIFAENDCIILILPHDFSEEAVRKFLETGIRRDRIEELLRHKLESSGLFGARFRENAARALLLPRSSFNRRMPLWLNRLRAKKLLKSVMTYDDFPVLLETWRSCLQEDFDMENLCKLLEEVSTGEVRTAEVHTAAPSPFSGNLIWQQTNTYMYSDDTPLPGRVSKLSGDILEEAVFSSQLRPDLDRKIAGDFEQRARRLLPGYAPSGADDLVEWVEERRLIGIEEWLQLVSAIQEDGIRFEEEDRRTLRKRLLCVRLPGAEASFITAAESLPLLLTACGTEPEEAELNELPLAFSPGEAKALLPDAALSRVDAEKGGRLSEEAAAYLETCMQAFRSHSGRERETEEEGFSALGLLSGILGQWLRSYGPVSLQLFSRCLPAALLPAVNEAAALLEERRELVRDRFFPGDEQISVCDAENLERILRMQRRSARPQFVPLPAGFLQYFLADYHGITDPDEHYEGLQAALETLFGCPGRAELWESEILPARTGAYQKSWLDSLLDQSSLLWLGCGNKKLTFCLEEDLDLFFPEHTKPSKKIKEIFPDTTGVYGFWDIAESSGLSSDALTKQLWDLVWKGQVSADRFTVLREGLASGFKAAPIQPDGGGGAAGQPQRGRSRAALRRRTGFNRWKNSRPAAANWFPVPAAEAEDDALAVQEVLKDRARQVLLRYGIIFKELLEHELKPLKWSSLFRSLRLMELSGEILTGHFFEGIHGLQFATHQAVRTLQHKRCGEELYILNAADPVSLCGVKLDGLGLPDRLPGTHIVFRGADPLLISYSLGKRLEFRIGPNNTDVGACLAVFSRIADRSKGSLIRLEEINGLPAAESPYRDSLLARGFRKDYKALVLEKGYI
jgi:ATP-dependent Lhr-like helicase